MERLSQARRIEIEDVIDDLNGEEARELVAEIDALNVELAYQKRKVEIRDQLLGICRDALRMGYEKINDGPRKES